jgi:hypothetical protein
MQRCYQLLHFRSTASTGADLQSDVRICEGNNFCSI